MHAAADGMRERRSAGRSGMGVARARRKGGKRRRRRANGDRGCAEAGGAGLDAS